jgi:hypothetical protein
MAQFALVQERAIYETPKVRLRTGATPRLYYPKDAIPLRTPFRDSVLHTIYESAQRELRKSLKSVDISTWQSYDEDDSPILLLTFWTDAEQSERLQVEKTVIDAIVEESKSWSDMQKKDYSETIYFGLEPI